MVYISTICIIYKLLFASPSRTLLVMNFEGRRYGYQNSSDQQADAIVRGARWTVNHLANVSGVSTSTREEYLVWKQPESRVNHQEALRRVRHHTEWNFFSGSEFEALEQEIRELSAVTACRTGLRRPVSQKTAEITAADSGKAGRALQPSPFSLKNLCLLHMLQSKNRCTG